MKMTDFVSSYKNVEACLFLCFFFYIFSKNNKIMIKL